MTLTQNRKPTSPGVIIGLLGLFLLTVVTGSLCAAQKEADKQTVARVNGEPITKEKLSERARIDRIFMALRSVPLFAEFLMETEEGEKTLDRYRKFVLKKLITERIVLQRAESLGITVSEEEINKRLDAIIERTKQVNSREELMKQLEKDRLTLHDLKEEISRKLLREKLKDEVLGKVSVSSKEIEQYYNEHKDSFRDKDGEIQPLTEVRSHIKEELRRNKKRRLWKEWLRQAKEEAKIVKMFEN
ncbi:MAG: SurA N-terminal domain-containing protein [Candidatus Bipolaricaulia bacterium]